MGWVSHCGWKTVLWKISLDSLDEGKICCKSYTFKLNKNHAIDKWIGYLWWDYINLLYQGAGFELPPAQPCHHPSVKKDTIPTPPHPTGSWKRLLAGPRISPVIRQRGSIWKLGSVIQVCVCVSMWNHSRSWKQTALVWTLLSHLEAKWSHLEVWWSWSIRLKSHYFLAWVNEYYCGD